jgi:hypothetical protein
MAMPPDKLMQLMGKNKGATPPAPTPAPTPDAGMSDAQTPPMASPMSTPEPKLGNQEGAMINLSMAMDLIEQALPSLGSESEMGQKALQAIRALTGVIGPRKGKTNELQQSEILQMLQSLPQGMGAAPAGMGGGMPPAPAPAAPAGLPPPPAGGAGGPAPQPM